MNGLTLHRERLALIYMAMKNMACNIRAHKAINDRVWRLDELPDLLHEYTYNGKVYFRVTSTDCDHTQAVYTHPIEPTVEAYDDFFDHLYDDAEGPVHARLLHPEDVPAFQPTVRDLALEAFEDGHPHCISEVRYESN
jgi:hypothetical protein